MTDRSSWWDDVDADLATAGAQDTQHLPDPWATSAVDGPSLTADQEAFLAGLDDQPSVPRLSGIVGEHPGADPPPVPGAATGSPPGDSGTRDS